MKQIILDFPKQFKQGIEAAKDIKARVRFAKKALPDSVCISG